MSNMLAIAAQLLARWAAACCQLGRRNERERVASSASPRKSMGLIRGKRQTRVTNASRLSLVLSSAWPRQQWKSRYSLSTSQKLTVTALKSPWPRQQWEGGDSLGTSQKFTVTTPTRKNLNLSIPSKSFLFVIQTLIPWPFSDYRGKNILKQNASIVAVPRKDTGRGKYIGSISLLVFQRRLVSRWQQYYLDSGYVLSWIHTTQI